MCRCINNQMERNHHTQLVWSKKIGKNLLESTLVKDVSGNTNFFSITILLKKGKYRVGKLQTNGQMEWVTGIEGTPQQEVITSTAVKEAVEEFKKFATVNGIMTS
jgi:hypothetical protein